MKYFRNLLTALLGIDTYQNDMVKQDYEQCLQDVRQLEEKVKQLEDQYNEIERLADSYSVLVENLRSRIKDQNDEIELYKKELKAKDEMIKQLKNHE